MSSVSSNENRFYVALEQSYGNAAAVTDGNRIPAVKLTVKQRLEKVQRKEKTGSRTFAGNPSGLRKETSFELKTYLTNWADQTRQPAYGPLFQACLGSAALLWGGGTVASATDPSRIAFPTPPRRHPRQGGAQAG